MKAIVTSILEASAEAVERRFAEVPAGSSLVEIRADRLRPAEVAGLVARSPRPAIVAARRPSEGGTFDGSEEERRAVLEAALDAGAAFVDVEHEGALEPLAWGPAAGRVILSHHGGPCDAAALLARLDAMASSPAARLKLVPVASSPDEAWAIRSVLEQAERLGRPLAAFAMGRPGAATRLLAPSWGSWGTYGAVAAGRETAPGQWTAAQLDGRWDVLRIGPSTRLFGLAGADLSRSPSPAMHLAGYRALGLDARYLPLEADRFESVVACCGGSGALGIEAIGVTIPFKEDAARIALPGDAYARAARAVNTLVFRDDVASGFNSDAPAVAACVRARLDPAGLEVAVAGSGGAARGAAVALREAGGNVTLYARDPDRLARAAEECGVARRPIAQLPFARWDVLIQATPVGGKGERLLPARALRGRLVLDMVYGPVPTPLLADARAAGLEVVDGFEMLVAQAELQFRLMTGHPAPAGVLQHAGRAWLDGPGGPQ
ncbi:MAG TPA: type I 3-dehydroquinate dehydratase [Candidatus Polarisedimenticolaceae bacterium]